MYVHIYNIFYFNNTIFTHLFSLHSSGTKHKTILEARSGLGPIKAYPRLGPKPSGEQGGGDTDPNTQERTFHCEICNVRVNSELQLKQVSEGHGVHHFFLLNACTVREKNIWSPADFAHWQRNYQSNILMVGLFNSERQNNNKKLQKNISKTL